MKGFLVGFNGVIGLCVLNCVGLENKFELGFVIKWEMKIVLEMGQKIGSVILIFVKVIQNNGSKWLFVIFCVEYRIIVLLEVLSRNKWWLYIGIIR